MKFFFISILATLLCSSCAHKHNEREVAASTSTEDKNSDPLSTIQNGKHVVSLGLVHCRTIEVGLCDMEVRRLSDNKKFMLSTYPEIAVFFLSPYVKKLVPTSNIQVTVFKNEIIKIVDPQGQLIVQRIWSSR